MVNSLLCEKFLCYCCMKNNAEFHKKCPSFTRWSFHQAAFQGNWDISLILPHIFIQGNVPHGMSLVIQMKTYTQVFVCETLVWIIGQSPVWSRTNWLLVTQLGLSMLVNSSHFSSSLHSMNYAWRYSYFHCSCLTEI